MLEWMERPHRRLNPLTGAWVLVSPQRAQRPWQGKVERVTSPDAVPYDPKCYLCPGNKRVGESGTRNTHPLLFSIMTSLRWRDRRRTAR